MTNVTDVTDIVTTRQLIIEQTQLKQSPKFTEDTWLLLGTMGCHLCDEAEGMLRLFCGVTPVDVQKVDIADLDNTLMMQFATLIPVILTKDHQLSYPFSIVDLQTLV